MKLQLFKVYNPDKDKTHYSIMFGNISLYSCDELTEAQLRYEHILDIGLKAYIAEIQFKSDLIKEDEIDIPESVVGDVDVIETASMVEEPDIEKRHTPYTTITTIDEEPQTLGNNAINNINAK